MKYFQVLILSFALFVGFAHAMENLVTRQDCQNAYNHMAQQALSWHDENAKNIPGSYIYSFSGFPGHALLTPDRQKECRLLDQAYRTFSNKFDEQKKEFLKAAEVGDVAKMELLLATGVDVEHATPGELHNGGRKTALMLAAGAGQIEACQFLLERKANVNQLSRDKETALTRASHSGHEEVCKLLIEAGAHINHCSDLGHTALHRAAFNGHKSVCDLLIKKGADMYYCKEERGRGFPGTILEAATCVKNGLIIGEMLVERMLNEPNEKQKEVLYTVMQCFRRMYPVERRNLKNIFIPYLRAQIRAENRKKVCRELCKVSHADHKISILKKYFAPELALYFAATREKDLQKLQMLIKQGVDVDTIIDENGHTALLAVAKSPECLPIFKLLTEAGADLNHADGHGKKVLWIAADPTRLPTCEFIVEKMLSSNGPEKTLEEVNELWPLEVRTHLLQKYFPDVKP